jgi:hypothetical protein
MLNEMKRQLLIVVTTLTAIAVVGFALYALRQREPVHQGRSLSAWLVEADTGSFPRQSRVPADEAIRQIGTNAFPMISQLLRARDSAVKSKLIPLVNRQSRVRIHITSQYEHYNQAIAACYALGPVAKPLVPEIAKALPNMKGVQPSAEQWLGELGPDAEAAIPALVAILEDKKNPTRFMAAQNLAHIAIHRPQDVVPVLNECLNDTNNSVRLQAGVALKILQREADKAALAKAGVR